MGRGQSLNRTAEREQHAVLLHTRPVSTLAPQPLVTEQSGTGGSMTMHHIKGDLAPGQRHVGKECTAGRQLCENGT